MKKIYAIDFSKYLGEEIQDFFYLRDVQYTDSGGANKWQKCIFSDKTGRRSGKAWSQNMNPAWTGYSRSVVRMTGRVEIYRDIYELNISNIVQARPEEYDILDFELSIEEGERQALISRFRELVHGVTDLPYQALLIRAYGNKERFSRLGELPAEWRYHHAYRGGWLEHTVDVAEECLNLAHICQSMRRRIFHGTVEVDTNLLVAGALLHDIGRLSTLNAGIEPRTTHRGFLVGAANDSVISVSALNNLLPKEERIKDLTKLLHVIAAAGGEESDIPPQTLEALILADARRTIDRANTYYSLFAEYDYENLDSYRREMVFSTCFGRLMMRGEKNV